MVLYFGLEALRHHAGVEITPVRYILIQLVLLVDLASPFLDQQFYLLLGSLQHITVTFDSVKEPDDVLCQ